MSRRLFIIGAGSFGRELECTLDSVPLDQRDWEVAGFLDDSAEGLGGFPSDYAVLGTIDDFAFEAGDLAVLAIAKPSSKRAVIERLSGRVELHTFVHHTATIGKFVSVGAGCIVGPGVIIGPNVTLGDAVFVNSGSMIGHDAVLGAYTSLMANVNIAGGCTIGADVFVASTVTVIPERTICDGAYIGAGSVVIRNVRKPKTVFGNPAKYL